LFCVAFLTPIEFDFDAFSAILSRQLDGCTSHAAGELHDCLQSLSTRLVKIDDKFLRLAMD